MSVHDLADSGTSITIDENTDKNPILQFEVLISVRPIIHWSQVPSMISSLIAVYDEAKIDNIKNILCRNKMDGCSVTHLYEIINQFCYDEHKLSALRILVGFIDTLLPYQIAHSILWSMLSDDHKYDAMIVLKKYLSNDVFGALLADESLSNSLKNGGMMKAAEIIRNPAFGEAERRDMLNIINLCIKREYCDVLALLFMSSFAQY